MASLHQEFDQPASEARSQLEHRVRAFEDAWRNGQRPALEQYLPPAGAGRLPCLVELIHAELELRLKAGEAARVEDYLERYPELAEHPAAVLDLLAAEYELRRRQEPGIRPENILERFPADRDALSERLAALSPSGRPHRDLIPAGPNGSGELFSTRMKDPNRTGDGLWPATPTSAAAMPPAERDPVMPGYQILKPLGRGGMGVVYLAQQVSLKRLVAIKIIRATGPADLETLARFRTEAETLASLQHPNIVQVFESGEWRAEGSGPLPYLVLEYVEGGSLAARLSGHPWQPHAAARLVETLAAGVHAAHQRGVIHRDLKPSNVLLTTDGTPKLTDFGLARQSASDARLTQSGYVLGSPAYMAPEQARGEVDHIGPRSDVFGLGAILYEMLTGRPPYQGTDPHATWEQAQLAQVTPPRALNRRIPRPLERICRKALAPDPAQRYCSAEELSHDLHRYRQRPRRLAVGLGLAGLVLLAGGLLLTMLPHRGARPQPEAEALQITAFEIQHYRTQGKRTTRVGTIGNTSFSTRFQDDSVRVSARLNAPAHCYLIAFNPDGKDQLCYPDATQAPSGAVQILDYPPDGDAAFALTDGSGLQAFVLLAARQPLPAYADWKTQFGPLPWRPSDADATWRFDGRQWKLLGSDRGNIRPLCLPRSLDDLLTHLKKGPGVEIIQVLAFPVRPNN